MSFGTLTRLAIQTQFALSKKLDAILDPSLCIDGNHDFIYSFVPKYVRPGQRVYDVGGGKHPFFSPEEKKGLELQVIGLDIDARELKGAPKDAYDQTVCASIETFRGNGDADLVICQSLLEHVANVEKSLASIQTILSDNGVAVVFVPSRNAVYSRLNLLLPESLKRRLLHAVFPSTRDTAGFPAFYDRCTPRSFKILCKQVGLEVVEERYYFLSSYFSFLFPLYVAWRAWTLAARCLCGNNAAETFSFAVRKARQHGD